MRFKITDAEKKQAKHPHEIMLINLITNHILVFVGLLGMASVYPMLVMIVPAASFVILGYILFRARQSKERDPWYVFCHWQLTARRCHWFIWMLVLMIVIIVLDLFAIEMGARDVFVYALAGVSILPTMIFVLVLIMLESDAMHQISNGRLPKWLVERYPNPEAVPIEE